MKAIISRAEPQRGQETQEAHDEFLHIHGHEVSPVIGVCGVWSVSESTDDGPAELVSERCEVEPLGQNVLRSHENAVKKVWRQVRQYTRANP